MHSYPSFSAWPLMRRSFAHWFSSYHSRLVPTLVRLLRYPRKNGRKEVKKKRGLRLLPLPLSFSRLRLSRDFNFLRFRCLVSFQTQGLLTSSAYSSTTISLPSITTICFHPDVQVRPVILGRGGRHTQTQKCSKSEYRSVGAQEKTGWHPNGQRQANGRTGNDSAAVFFDSHVSAFQTAPIHSAHIRGMLVWRAKKKKEEEGDEEENEVQSFAAYNRLNRCRPNEREL